MAQIIGVHGIWQQNESLAELQAHWGSSLQEGLRRIGSELQPSFDLVYYGDLFRYPARRPPGWTEPEPAPEGPFAPEPQGPTAALARHMVDDLEEIPEGHRTLRELQEVLRWLCEQTWLAKAFQSTVIRRDWLYRCFDQLDRYLNDRPDDQPQAAARGGTIRDVAVRRVTEAIGPDTALVIGHSLGSVVAYEALHHPAVATDVHLLTVGSPLGIPTLVLDALRPPPAPGKPRGGVWPPRAHTWTNLAGENDFIALVKSLAPIFQRAEAPLQDWEVDTKGNVHGIGSYLSQERAAEAILAALDRA
ncbi:MAG: hypothetical protein KTR31_30650 [Myxococcales bacterium]|nr:hypothetical protein [Myxococcales bacterium]